MESFINSIEKEAGIPGLAGILAERLSGASLNTLLLEVYKLKTAKMSPAMLLEQYRANRLVQPSGVEMIGLVETELSTLRFLRDRGFQPLELSPVAAVGTCSVVATVGQDKVLTALRNTEVVSDATNCLALHIADVKGGRAAVGEGAHAAAADVHASGEKSAEASGGIGVHAPGGKGMMRFCTVHRHIRTQSFSDSRWLPHFKIGCMVTSGYTTGGFGFECEALAEQFGIMHSLLKELFGIEHFRCVVKRREGDDPGHPAIEKVYPFLAERLEGVEVFREDTPGKNDYYKGVQCKLYIQAGGREWEIADGGPVDWTQRLLSNRKERLVASGFGLELLYKMKNGSL